MTSPPAHPASPFVLPDGLSLALGGNSIVIRHSGDILLEQSLGRKLSRVDCGGDLTLRFGPITGALRAEGRVVVDGQVDAQEIRGDVIVVGDHEVRARALVARTRVEIGRATLDVDVVVAPEVVIHPDATGRIRIVDCLNERPPLRVRGCLSLDEFEQDFGGAAEFLARRGVIPINPLPVPVDPDLEVTVDDAVEQQRLAEAGRSRSAPRGLRLLSGTGGRGHAGDEPRAFHESSTRPAAEVRPRPAPTDAEHSWSADARAGMLRQVEPTRAEARTEPRTDAPLEAPTEAPRLPDPPVPIMAEVARAVEVSAPAAQHAPLTPPAAPTSAPPPPSSSPPAAPASVGAPPPAASPAPAASPVVSAAIEAPLPKSAPEPIVAPEPAVAEPPRRPARPARDLSRHEPRLRRMIARIVAAYEGKPPEPVAELGRIANGGRMDELLSRIDDLWVDLLRHHVGAQTQPPRAVLVGFLSVNALISG